MVNLISPEDGARRAPNTTLEMVATVTDDVAVSGATLIWTNQGNAWGPSAQAPLEGTAPEGRLGSPDPGATS